MSAKIILYARNWGLLMNQALMTLIGQDPRKTISALVWLKGWNRIEQIINRIYDDDHHCRHAAQGWDSPSVRDRSLW